MKIFYSNKQARKAGLLIGAILFSLIIQAQKSLVKGVIRTSDGKAAAQVNVQLKEIKKGTVTDGDGSYSIADVEPGSYTIIVSFVGLQTVQKNIQVTGHETGGLDFTLVENENQLAEIVVTSSRSMNEKPVTIGKLPIKPMDLPQSMMVLSKDVLQRQQVLHISDALQNVSGVYLMGNTGGFQEEIAARGFSFSSSNTFKNGIRYNNSIMPELSSVEKLEFLKGGSAILFGNVSAGGVMNIVTRKPKFDKGGEISFRTGSYDFYKPSIDVYGSLNTKQTAAFRLNTAYEKAGSFRDMVKTERLYINPAFLFKLNSKTELLIEGDYLKDDRTPDFGTGAINYEVADVPRNAFLGVSWGYNKVDQTTANATLTHYLNNNWQIKAVAGLQDYNSDLFAAARPNTSSAFIQTNGTWIRGLQKSRTAEDYYLAQLDITGKFRTGTINHTLLAGADADRYKTAATTFVTTAYNNALSNTSIKGKNIYDTINVFDPYGSAFNKRNDIPYLAPNLLTTSPVNRMGIYVQDLIAVSDKLKILAGVRYSIQENKKASVDTLAKATRGFVAAYTSKAFSPRLGIVYQPLKTISLFASYTNNFSPNTGVDTFNSPLKPSIIDQYELGAKTDLFKGLLSVNVTAYKIVNSDFALSVLNPPASIPAAKELVGEVTSKGVEIDITTKSIQGFNCIAGYSYNDTRYTKSNGHNSSVKAGDRLRYNPSHTANASIYYNFSATSALHGFSLGAGAFYVGDRLAGRNNTATNPTYKLMALPDYTLLDVSAGYATGKYAIRVKITNLANKLSYNVHDDNSVNPVAPRQFAATVSYKL
ncbi:MAG: TonB-dependent receptor [Chitinophagaceae bacterium]|nr:TonB-dependent receptor [Chitinophagaceae bacterium]